MTRKIIIATASLLTLAFVVLASPAVNFNGSWVMDRDRSFGQPAGMQQSMTVSQTENKIEVETKLILPNSERTVKDTYMLDGKEYDFSPPLPLNAPAGTPAAKGKRSANWLPNGAGILVNETITNETPKGPSTTQMMRKWVFTGDGEITITTFVDTAQVSYESKRVFVKK